MHLSTTLRCYPNYLIFSDHEENYATEHVLDALDTVSPEIVATHPDFELYRHLLRHSRESLNASELRPGRGDSKSNTGNNDNAGWKLHKWKFLPMMNRTLVEYPDMRWYVFLEADGFVLWRQLLKWLAFKDHTEPCYTGSQVWDGRTHFAHGGSGFVVSQPAMRMVVEHYTAHKAYLEARVSRHWAGDAVLGLAFRDAGVSFTNAWPMFQGDFLGLVPYAGPDGRPVADNNVRQWCYPTISYHHMTPSMILDLWNWEQQWEAEDSGNTVSCPSSSELDVADQPRNVERTPDPPPQRHLRAIHHAANNGATR